MRINRLNECLLMLLLKLIGGKDDNREKRQRITCEVSPTSTPEGEGPGSTTILEQGSLGGAQLTVRPLSHVGSLTWL